MHRPSPLQAELDAQSLRRHDVEQRFIAAPETYTALAGRPGRVLVAGIGVGVVVLALVAVISIAGATRAARARSQAATEAGRANPPTATTRAPSQQPAAAERAGADGGEVVRLGLAEPKPAVFVSDSGRACRQDRSSIKGTPVFGADGRLDKVVLEDVEPSCVGSSVTVTLSGADGRRLGSRTVVIERSGTVIVDGWEDDSIDLVDTGRVLVTI
jgi:hypothetical protein